MTDNSRFLLLLYRHHQRDFHLLTLTPSKLQTMVRPPIFLVLVWDTIFVVYWSPNSAHFICGQLGDEGKSSYAVTFCTTNKVRNGTKIGEKDFGSRLQARDSPCFSQNRTGKSTLLPSPQALHRSDQPAHPPPMLFGMYDRRRYGPWSRRCRSYGLSRWR